MTDGRSERSEARRPAEKACTGPEERMKAWTEATVKERRREKKSGPLVGSRV